MQKIWLVGHDFHDLAIRMHKNTFAVMTADLRIFSVHRKKYFPEYIRGSDQAGLGSPVIHHGNGVYIRPGPNLDFLQVVLMYPVQKFEELGRLFYKVDESLFHGADELKSFEGADERSHEHKTVRFLAEAVHIFPVEAEGLLRRFELLQVSPIFNQRILDDADGTIHGIAEHASPLIDIGSFFIPSTFGFQGLGVNSRR
jgi:hypothetical protein